MIQARSCNLLSKSWRRIQRIIMPGSTGNGLSSASSYGRTSWSLLIHCSTKVNLWLQLVKVSKYSPRRMHDVFLDIRNNSAWNQRYFLISNTNDLNNNSASDLLARELDFCLTKIKKCIDNESSWNYLRGLITHLNIISSLWPCYSILNNKWIKFFKLYFLQKLDDEDGYPQNIIDFCKEKVNSEKNADKSPFVITFLVDYNFLRAKKLKKQLLEKHQDDIQENLKSLIKSSIEMLQSLIDSYDVIRHNYWEYLISKWKLEFSNYLWKPEKKTLQRERKRNCDYRRSIIFIIITKITSNVFYEWVVVF